MIKGPGIEFIGRLRNRIGLFALFAALAVLLLPYFGTDTAYSASNPVAEALSPVAQEATPVTIYLSGSDPDGEALTFEIMTLPTNGGVLADGPTISGQKVLSGNTVTFTGPNLGTSTFTYRVTDTAFNNSATATVTVSVIQADLAPVALDLNVTNASSTLTVFLGGSDAEGDIVTFVIESPLPTNGVLFDGGTQIFSTTTPFTLSGRAVSYTANSTPSSDSFTYSAADALPVSSATATVSISNNAGGGGFPVAYDVSVNDDANTDIFIALPGYDPDNDGQTFYVISDSSNPSSGNLRDGVTSSPISSGRVALTSNLVEYRPNPSTSGTMTFAYEIDAGGDTSNTATVTIALGHAPDADNLAPAIDEDIDLRVLLSGSHPTDDALTFIITSLPSNGSLIDAGTSGVISSGSLPYSLSSGGNIATYDSSLNFNGSNSFDYKVNNGGLDSTTATVSILVNSVNDLPAPLNDSPVVDEGSSVNVDVLANDNDNDGDSLTITISSLPSNGSASVNDNGSPGNPDDDTIDYSHDGSETTSDSFMYQADDGNGGQINATVNVTVNAINDAPVAAGDNNASLGVSPNENTPFSITASGVLANDTDAEGGALTVVEVLGQTANVGAPVATTQGATVTLNADGSFAYDPTGSSVLQALAGGANLDDSFTYLIKDDVNAPSAGPATVTLSIAGVNDAPVAFDDSPNVDEGNTLNIDVLANDSDAESDPLSVFNVTSPSNGSVTLKIDGTIDYTHNGSETVTDSFAYQINDGNGGSDTATVNITVNPINDDPVALDDFARIAHAALVNLNVLVNDSDVDGGPLTVTISTSPSNGTAVPQGDNTINYTHDGTGTNSDSFVYQVADGNGGFDTATVTIEILGVNTTNDVNDGTCDSAHCSLREAIILANTDSSFDTIAFGIPIAQVDANGDYVIKPGSQLPKITATDLVIDGTTQAGYATEGRPVVLIRGDKNNNYRPFGLDVGGSHNTVRGLAINAFDYAGIHISGTGSHTIQGNFVGTNSTGSVDIGNSGYGIWVENSPDNMIGGTGTGEGNLISGNNSVGVLIHLSASTNNRVEGNLIGTDAAGTGAIPNGYGVYIASAPANFIGSSATSTPNVISGNRYEGVSIVSSGSDNNVIQGNYIGTDITGSKDLGNGWNGVAVQSSTGNLIGGDTLAKRNVISGNGQRGVYLNGSSTSGNTVSGNIIGLDVSGTQRLGNSLSGVWIQSSINNVIGGTLPGERNIISDNRYSEGAIYINAANNNTIQGNYIGTDITGTADRGNAGRGIFIINGSEGNLVGSSSVTPGNCDNGCNIVAFNGNDGIAIRDGNPVRNAVLGNSIFANSGIGIDLSTNGPTPNDLATKDKKADDDDGANNIQNFPKLALARLDANDNLAVRYDVPSDPTKSTYPLRIEFFKVGLSGKPMEFLGSDTYDTSDFAAGFRDVLLNVASIVTVENDDQVAATTTDNDGNTSELSEIAVVGVTPPHVVNSTGDLGDADTVDSVCDTGGASIGGQSPCTLRAALEQAEAILGPDSIIFDIPVPADPDADPTYSAGTGVFTFKPQTRFEIISDELVIDGTTQIGYAATPLIEINGSDAGNQANGLHITGGNSTFKGLAINGFDDDGIRLQFQGKNLIEANFIGTDATGLTTDPDATPDSGDETANGGDGIRISRSPNNRIINNVVSGNASNGVTVFGIESSGNTLQNNRIGADVNGLVGLPNVGDGVFILDASDNSLSGGNVVAFNLGRGVAVDAGSNNALSGNAIFGNNSLGIDLGNDGLTSNDVDDADSGSNNLQNSPVINRVRVQVDLKVDVDYRVGSATANSAYPLNVEFFRADGSGQGRVLLGKDTYFAGDFSAGGFKTVDLGLALVLNLVKGDQIVGLATDADGNTSEFSLVTTVTDQGSGQLFVVDSTEDGADASVGDGNCDNGSGACTLRAAIQEANVRDILTVRGLDRIDFAIGAGPATIAVTSPLPPITDALIIDGTSQPGFATTPIVTLNGSAAGSNADGLTITGGSSLVRGLVISGFRSDGIVLKNAGDNIIAGNFLGTNVSGLTEAPNFQVGLRIEDSPDNLVGGSTEADRNVISGNQQRGVLISGSNSNGNRISGNFIGVGVDGLTIVDNGLNGIRIIDAPGNIIGGVDPGEGNVISGNSEHGVLILNSGSTGNLVQGNFIGTDLTGLVGLGNGGSGVRIENADNNTVGGSAANLANNITAGECTGACNAIAFNGDDGIYLQAGTTNTFLSNSLYQNTGLGIDLKAPLDDNNLDQGITSNDFGDFDSGPNDLQNSPVFAAVAPARIDASDSLIVEYSVESDVSPGSPITVQFFVADADDHEGAIYVGTDTYTSAGVRTTIIPGVSAIGVADGDVLLASATDASGSTSEFTEVPVTVVEATFFVNTNVDLPDLNTGDGICSAGVKGCTLRAAIMEANAIAGQDAIHFNLPTTDPGSLLLTFTISNKLPAITDTVVIDGTTQLGFSSAPIIILNGAAKTGPGLEISAGESIVRGLEITLFDGDGILLNTNADAVGGSVIEGNLIRENTGSGVLIDDVPGNLVGGTTSQASNTIRVNAGGNGVTISGAAAVNNRVQGNSLISNGSSGVGIVDAPDNLVGGTDTGAANIIIGNVRNGVTISGGTASGNVIEGNFIGTDDANITGSGNQANGVVISGASDNTVGGTSAAAANVISANALSGLVLEAGAFGNVIEGNIIGTSADGLSALANSGAGVLIVDSFSNTVGGTASSAANLISGNGQEGVAITGSGSSSNLVQGNLIGTDSTGATALGNTGAGLRISGGQNNTIGGAVTEAANVISANGQDGVLIAGPTPNGNAIEGNFIGTDSTATVALGNTLAGVHITSNADGNVIGGTTGVSVGTCTGVCNIIANNVRDGVYVESGTGNVIQGNSTFANGSLANDLGIDLAVEGRTPNVSGVAENFPVITSALVNGHGNLILRYDVDSPLTSSVEFYQAEAGGLQGKTLLGTDDYAGSSAGTKTVNLGAATALGISSSDEIVATTTSTGNTSEFSDVAQVANAATFTVDVNSDEADNSPGDGSCNNGSGKCTLRAAIEESNATEGANTIKFGFSGTISLLGPLPTSTVPVIIDASSPYMTLDGTSIGSGDGLVLAGGDSVVRGLRIVNFPGNGIVIFSNGSGVVVGNANGGTILEDNQIGTNGAADQGNALAGVRIVNSVNNVVGGLTAGDGNLISGNDGEGVRIQGAASTGNVLQGNLIGTNAAGTTSVPNSGAGVLVAGGSDGNVIGGTTGVVVGSCEGACNIIAFNGGDGVEIQSGLANAISSNAIFLNALLGIQAGTQNVPDLKGARVDVNNDLFMTFGILSPDTNIFPLKVEFFLADADSEEGKTYLGFIDYGDTGLNNSTVSLGNVGVALGQSIVASATNSSGATTDFSQGVSVTTAAVFVVDSNLDSPDNIPSDGICADISGNCTLRAAIQEANAVAGVDEIHFALAPTELTILPDSPLPDLNDPVRLVGRTQAGYAGIPLVVIDGSSLGVVDGLRLTASGSSIMGMVVTNFGGNGILIASSDSVIGGAAGDGNEIHSNTSDGVRIESGVDNAVRANSIHDNAGLGINLVGLLDQPNGVTDNDVNDDDDIAVGPNSLQNFPVISEVRIDAVGNLIVEYSISSLPANSDFPITAEFFTADAVGLEGQVFLGSDSYTNTAQATQIANLGQVSVADGQLVLATATDASGETSEFGATVAAVQVPAFVVTSVLDSDDINSTDGKCDVGDGTCTLRAAISQSNVRAGVDGIQFKIDGPGPHVIHISTQLPQVTDALVLDGYSEPDYISTPVIEIDGASAVSVGLEIVSGDSIVRGLTLRGFNSHAIVLDTGGNNTLQGNFLGTSAQGNMGSGVFITGGSSANIVGGTGVGEGNTFVNNQGDGVTVESGVDNAMLANSFDSVGGLAIDLGDDAATANDIDDADTGANNLQNFPTLASAQFVGGALALTYSVSSATGNSTYPLHVEFYAREQSGALNFLGSDTYTDVAQATQIANIGIVPINSTDTIVAAATDADGQGNTSEFSSAIASPPQADLSVVVTSPTDTITSGLRVTFTVEVTNNGPSAATNVVVSKALVTGLAFATTSPAPPTQGSYDSVADLWTIGALANGATVSLGFVFDTAAAAAFTSKPVVSANEFDSDSSNNTGNKTVTVTAEIISAPAGGSGGGGGGGAAVVPKAIGHTHDGITMRFIAYMDQDAPSSQTLGVFNPGRGTLDWSIISGVTWISVSPRSGTSRNATPNNVDVAVDATGLELGEYTGTLSIVAGEVDNSPQIIEVVLTVAPPPPEDQKIAFSPGVLQIIGVEGDPNPALQSFEVWNAGDLTLDWSLEADVDWLSFLPGGGTSQGERILVTASADATSFEAGTYLANVTINADVAVNAPLNMPVELVVLPPPPVIDTDQGSYSIIAPESGPNPGRRVVQVINNGGRDMQWSARVDQPWLSMDIDTGTSSAGQPAELGLLADVTSLALGTYDATLEITVADATNSPYTVTVTLVVDLPNDEDKDGVPDIIEDDGPNGGDANGDNVPDSQQANISSLPASRSGTFVTLESSPGSQLVDVRTLENPSPGDAPSRVGFPLAFYEYSVVGTGRGGSAEVVFTLGDDSAFKANKFYKYGPTPDKSDAHWYEFTYDGETGVELLGNRIVMHLVDGQRGDDDLTDDGKIVGVGAPADDRRVDLVMTGVGVRDIGTLSQPLKYTVTVVNQGPAVASNVMVSQPLPSGFELVTATPSKGVCNTGDGVQCNLRSLLVGESATVEFIVRTTALISEPFPYETRVSSDNTDVAEENNVVSVNMIVADPTLALAALKVNIIAIEGNPRPQPHALGITNSGPSGALRWTVAGSCDAADSSAGLPVWMQTTPTPGNLVYGDGNALIGVDISTLASGTYNSSIVVSDVGAGLGCQTVDVQLSVLPAIGRPQQDSVNLQQWELESISDLVQQFFEAKGESAEAGQQPWFAAAATLADRLESDETIRRGIVRPSQDFNTSLTSLSSLSETLGNWSGQGELADPEQFAAVDQFTFALTGEISEILSGQTKWDPDQLGLIRINATADEKLFVIYSRADQALLVHFDTFDGLAGQIDGVIPVTVEAIEGVGDQLMASDTGSVYSRRASVLRAAIGSPGELRVYDEVGRVTGTVNGKITVNMPNSTFFRDEVFVMLPTDAQALAYHYEIVGTEEGLYGIEISFLDSTGENTPFQRTGVVIGPSEVHSYTVDWPNLGEDRGWLWRIDADNDGNFETEFPPAIVERGFVPAWFWPEVVIGLIVGLVLALIILWVVVSWSEPIRDRLSNGLTPLRKVLARFGINLKLPRLAEPGWSKYLRF